MLTIKKETKNPALLKLPIYSTELAAVIFFFLKSTVKCTKALAAIPFFHRECVNLTISQQSCSFFFLSCSFFFLSFSIFFRTAGEGERFSV